MALHRRIVHDFIDPIHVHIHTVHCPACRLYFHNRVRVLNHLEYRSKVCRLSLLLQGPCISKDEAQSLDVDCREGKRKLYALGLRTHAATNPVFRLTGPIPLPPFFTGGYGNVHILGLGRNNYHDTPAQM